jgi:methylenetetrahydrofolate reductase (NADPH)
VAEPRIEFEVMPFDRAADEAAQLPGPAVLTVTCSPRHGPDHTVEFGARLRRLGHTVIVHLAARMVRDVEHADALLRSMARAGINDALVIGGDSPEPLGAFSSAGELLEVLVQHPQRPRSIGIAAYPEGHPLIDEQTLWSALERKAVWADYMTTQMCFEPEGLVRWLRSAREREVRLPVMIGLPGVVDRRRLLEVSIRIGVGPSVAFLRKQRGVRELLSRGSPADRLLAALAPSLRQPEAGVSGFHYCTFNQLLDTWAWEHKNEARATLVR